MPVDASLVGREFPSTAPVEVTEESVRAFAEATGGAYAGSVPPTWPIVLAFAAMQDFLSAERLDLFRVIHGEQRFAYERPVVVGDVLIATLSVTGVRQLGGADIITTSSAVTDAEGTVVCTARATLVHGGGA